MLSFGMVAPKPKDVLPLAQEITRLETQLAEAKRKWNLMFGVQEPQRKVRVPSLDGLTSKVLRYMEESSGTVSTIHATAEAVGEQELIVGRALYRLAKANKIANPARGLYASLGTQREEEVPIEETS